MQRPSPGVQAWIGLALYVTIWDLTHKDSLSRAFARNKPTAVIIWTYLTLHLTEVLPPKYDPLRRYRQGRN